MTMPAVCLDIMNLLAANGLGTIGNDLFAFAWGEGIDSQTLIIDQAGLESSLKESHEQPVFQVLLRGAKGADMNTSYNAMRAIHEFLIERPTEILSGNEYYNYIPTSNVLTLGRDNNDRAVYSCNYRTFRQSIGD